MENNIFVLGATGIQGSNISKLLISKGNNVVTLSRSNEQNQSNVNGLQIVFGSLDDKLALSKALKDVDKAVFTFPLIFDVKKAIKYTRNFIEVAEEQDISLAVFNSSFDLPNDKTGLIALDLKVAISELFEKSNIDVITLMPDIYIDNLVAPWSLPLILEKGILPYPARSGQKVPWISHSDLAKFVASAIKKPDLAGKVLPIGGNLFTGEEIATAISNQIGKKVNYIGLTPDDFEKQLVPAFGELASKEISNLYRYVENNSDKLVNKDFERSQNLLSVKPQSIQEWVKTVNWKM